MMKNRTAKIFLFAFLASACVVAIGCSKDASITPDPEQVVVIEVPDTRLAAAIKAELKLSADAKITNADMLKLDSLNIDAETDTRGDRSEITNLTGLQAAANLQYLHVGFTKVTDLSPIKGLKKVTYLRLNNTPVTDLSPIATFNSLTYFNANTATAITDISPLGKNTGLKELILRDVVFGKAGMATIGKFTKLYRLNVRNTGITSVAVIAQLMSKGALLKTTEGAAAAGKDAVIDLRGNTLTDLNSLDAFTNTCVNLEN